MAEIIEKKKRKKKNDLFAMQFSSDPKADMDSFNAMMEDNNKPYKLREDDTTNSALEVMIDSNDKQDDAYIGPFWYDPKKKEVYGNVMTLASDKPFYTSNGKNIKTGNALHKNIWAKEEHRKKDKRFQGDYKLKPRGRVFEVENEGFKVYTGNWINQYPEAKEEIIDVFQLPKDNTEFVIDEHWDIGHGWSEDIYLGDSYDKSISNIEHKRIDEGGLSRIYNHIKDDGTFAVIGSQDKDTGEDRSSELRDWVRSSRIEIKDENNKVTKTIPIKLQGFNWIKGTYKYENGTQEAVENSMMIYNISKEDALKLGKALNQETILWKDPDFFGYIYVENGEVPDWNKGGFKGNMSFDKSKIDDIGGSSALVGRGWSLPKNRRSKNAPFVYECFLLEPALQKGYVSEYLIDSYDFEENNMENKNFVIEELSSEKKFYNIDRNGLYSSGSFFFNLIDYCEDNDIYVEWKEGKDRQGNYHLTKFKIELDNNQKKELLSKFPYLKDELRRERIKESKLKESNPRH